MLKSFSTNSIKYIRSVVKSLPNKIYMVEIKIKSQPQNIIQAPRIISSTTNELKSKKDIESSYSSQAVSADTAQSTKAEADHYMFEDVYKRDQSFEEENVSDKLSQLVQSLESKCRSFERSPISAIISLNSVTKQLGELLRKHPELVNADLSHKMVALLLKICQVSIGLDAKFNATNAQYSNQIKVLQEYSRSILAQLGHVNPPKGKGIRILSIDGGGTRGILVIEILRQIEKAYGKPIHQIFDLICGVSTGAIISMLLGALRIPIDECEHHYRQVSSYLFNTDIITGTGRLLWSHAYYDTAVWEKILKEMYGSSTIMSDTKKNPDCPNLVAISAIVNLHSLQPYLFRNYELSPGSKPFSHFQGGSQHKLWEAVRASAAAPGYFEEFTLGDHVHQDGGILINNPTAVAVHEAKLLWPNEKIQCVLSLGSGRYQPDTIFEDKNKKNVQQSSLKHKIARLIDSATDTEMVHRLMQDLLPFNTYYRINPIIRDRANIDENRPEKLENMKVDAQMYLRKNSHKFSQVVTNLRGERTYTQQFMDSIKQRIRM